MLYCHVYVCNLSYPHSATLPEYQQPLLLMVWYTLLLCGSEIPSSEEEEREREKAKILREKYLKDQRDRLMKKVNGPPPPPLEPFPFLP